MQVRLANENELVRVNELRRQLYDFHASVKPEVFKPGSSKELQDSIYAAWNDPEQEIAIAEQNGEICGYAVLHHINRPEHPVMLEQDFLNVDEICVDEAFRGQGVASAMINFIRDFAVKKGFHRIELFVWEFNQKAIGLYENAGFSTFRYNMEMII